MRNRTLALFLIISSLAAVAAAQRLPRTVFPVHYDLMLTPNLADDTFAGEETIAISVQIPMTSIRMNAIDQRISEASVTQNGTTQTAAVAFDLPNEMLTLTFASPLVPGPASIHLAYTAPFNKELKGFYVGSALGRKYASTQFEATDARRAFPSFDEPDMKATFAVTAIVDDGDLAVSNGSVISETAGPVAGKRTFKFSTTPRMSSYLVALTVGPLDCLKDEVDGIPLRVCSTRDKVASGKFAMDVAKAVISWYNRYYGVRYPFGKLDQVGIPDFAAGAMENSGDIISREIALLVNEKTDSIERMKAVAGTISHEIAHQWFGDLVTMKWWNDIWLNEGFATFMEYKPLKDWKPDWDFGATELLSRETTMTTDALQSTRPIRAEATTSREIEAMFDSIAYGKTAHVLRMVESYIGEDAFRQGLRDYFATNAYSNTAAEDFTRAMDRASSKPVADVISSFVRQPGLPLVIVDSECQNGSTLVTLTQQRFFSDASRISVGDVWTLPVCYGDDCQLIRTKSTTFSVSGCNPLMMNRGGRGYYVTQYSPEEALRVAKMPALTPAERYALARDEWMLLRPGRRSVDQFLALADAMRGERNRLPFEPLKEGFEFIGDHLTTPATDASFRRWVADYVRPITNELGWARRAGESESDTELRALALNTLGYVGRDRATLAKASELATKELAKRGTLDPSLVETVFTLAARRSDPAFFDRLVQAYAKTNDPQVQRSLRTNVTQFSDPKLSIRAIEWALSPAVRTQDAAFIINGVLGNPSVQNEAWTYAMKNWNRIQDKLPDTGVGAGRGGPVVALSKICDRQLREEVVGFFKAHPVAGTERRLAQSLEQSAQCVALRDAQAPKLSEWAKSIPPPKLPKPEPQPAH